MPEPETPPPEPDSALDPTRVEAPPRAGESTITLLSDGTRRQDEPEPLALDPILGRYRLEDELGRGGMGVVVRALDTELGRRVAIKLVRQDFSQDATLLARFDAEARVTAQLQHPAIVPVYEVGRAPDGRAYYAMKLVEGETLARVRAAPPERRPSLTKLLHHLLPVARAIAFAHERGVVHRDLKPANVMVGRFGEVHIMDWGLAKRVGAPESESTSGGAVPVEPGATRAGSILGTPGYMSPEQAAGVAVGPPADVFALGAILYFLLTGRTPYRGTLSEILTSLVRGAPPEPPSRLEQGVPPDVEHLCLAALAHEPSDRPPSAAAFAEALERHLEGRPASAVRAEDAAYLKTYDPSAFRRPSVTVDVVLLGRGARVWLLLRRKPPFAGCWGFPGGFVNLEESLEAAAARAFKEKTGLPGVPELIQLGAFGDPARDPRMRVIDVAFAARVDEASLPVDEGHAWFDVGVGADGPSLLSGGPVPAPALAFDHARILTMAVERLK